MMGKLTAAFVVLASAAAPASAQTLVAKAVTDPQAHVAEQIRPCQTDVGACLRATFLDAFGEGVLKNTDLAASQKLFDGFKAIEWAIIADTDVAGEIRWIHALLDLSDESALGLRYEFRKSNGQWRLTDITYNGVMRELFGPMPPGATAVPIRPQGRSTR